MADTQDNALVAPVAGPTETQDRPTAATEQTGSASVKSSSDADIPQDTADEPADDAGADQDGGDKKPKSEVQKRIDSYRRRVGRAERERDRALEELERSRSVAQPAQAPSNVDTSAKPRLDQYASYDDYQEALTEWKVDQKLEARETKRATDSKKQSDARLQSERRERFLESSEDAREKHEDFDEVVFDPKNKVTPVMAALLGDTDNPGEVAYFLARNPDEAKRIASLPPTKVAIELGKIEVKLSTPAPKKTSNAPPPASKPSGGGRAAPKSPKDMSPDEIYARFKG